MITRNATTVTISAPTSGSCLDCPNCKGACWTAFDVATVPATVLKTKDK